MYENIKQRITDDEILILEIDLKVNGRPTGSGKNISIASTGGTVPIDNTRPETISLNLFKKRETINSDPL